MKRIFSSLLFLLVLSATNELVYAQNTHATQFSNELRFARPLAQRWSGEFTFSNTWMPTPPADGLFDKYSQWSLGGWGHNYIAKRWRLSLGAFFYHKLEIGEPEQISTNELRFSGQGIYYIKKIGYTVTSRSRLEWRNLQDADDNYNTVLRLRQQVKLIVPLNAKSIRERVIYFFASDEVFFKTPSDVAGDEVFDRNRFDLGLGYSITNNVNVELYYTNEWVPRERSEINSIINLDFSFRNLLDNLRKKYFTPTENVPDE